MAFVLIERDRRGNQKQQQTFDTVEEAMKGAENGYASFLSQHWRRRPDSAWEADEPATGGTWRIEPARSDG